MGPAKLQDYKIHKDPPGINGDLVEGRIMHDAFLLEAKKDAVYVAAAAANVTNAPVITDDTTNTIFAIASNTSNAVEYYTIDGTDPRYSTTVLTFAANVNYSAYTNGTVIKAYAADITNGVLPSTVATATLTV